MNQLAIIGAGQLGSRHLQALAALDRTHHIFVVEPADACVERAKSRWGEVATATSPEVSWLRGIAELPPTLDVVIVATAADVRRAAIEELLARAKVRHLVLEKVLFQSVADYAPMARDIAVATATAWVNCPRRLWHFYTSLRARLAGEVRLSVTGSRWGLGSSALHFLDLFAFLAGGDELAVDALHVTQISSFRAGFIELVGELAGHSAQGSFAIASMATGEVPVLLEIACPQLRAIVREGEAKASVAAPSDGWTWREEVLEMLPQSRLTNRIAADLLATGTCGLTPLAASVRHHLAFLEPLARALGVERCPIT